MKSCTNLFKIVQELDVANYFNLIQIIDRTAYKYQIFTVIFINFFRYCN